MARLTVRGVPFWYLTSQPGSLSLAIHPLMGWKRSVLVMATAIAKETSSSATTERPRELGDYKGVGHFEAKF